MKATTESNIGWMINNGSGWNHHRTADALKFMTCELPTAPLGYGVLIGPISDKPLGLRCALVKVLNRKLSPVISLHGAGGNYLAGDLVRAIHDGEPDEMETVEQASAYLASVGYVATTEQPEGWPVGNQWFKHPDGTWASVGVLDDGCEGEADSWARDRFGMDVEIVKSCKIEQQNDDGSAYFIRKMSEAISKIESR